MTPMTRRRLLSALAAAPIVAALPSFAQTAPAIVVAKDPNCGCCGAWVDILREAGFDVTVDELGPEGLRAVKVAGGVPAEMASCHTGRVEGYVIEGHVPVADIRRLLDERPDALGLAVPGMPWGSPGMGPEDKREAYDVYLLTKDGGAEVFSSYAAA